MSVTTTTQGPLLVELIRLLTAEAELDELLYSSVSRLVRECGARRGLIFSVHPERPGLCFMMANSDDSTAFRLPVKRGAVSGLDQVMGSRLPLVLRDVNVSDRIALYPSGVEALQTIYLFPVIVDGDVFSTLELHCANESLTTVTTETVVAFSALIAPKLFESDAYRSLGDQTQRRSVDAVEVELRGELEKYREFFERASDGIALLNSDGVVVRLNPAGERIMGCSASGVQGRRFVDFVLLEERSSFESLVGGRPRKDRVTTEYRDLRLETTTGDRIVVSISSTSALSEDDLTVLTFRDVTEQRTLAAELRQTKDFLERLIDSAVGAIVASDATGNVVLFSKGAEQLFGWAAEQVVAQRGIDSLFARGVYEGILKRMRSNDHGGVGRLSSAREDVTACGGKRIPVRLSASIIYDGKAEVGVVLVLSDQRERLQIEQRLYRAQAKLVQSEKQALLAELAGTTAHELNQPLTSVMGYAQLLQRRIDQNDENYHAATMIVEQSERMAEIVRQIGRITHYETKPYVGDAQILDLDRATDDREK